MKIVVTGGAGFIGSCLLARLNAEAITDIIVVDEIDHSGKWKNLVGKTIGDYIDKNRFPAQLESGALGMPDMIVHMGACSSTTETDTAYLMENNYEYSKRLAIWCLAHKVPFLYASSAATYGAGELGYSDADDISLRLKPLNPYGYSKQLFDAWLIKNGLTGQVTGFKFFNVFGPNEYHKGEMRSVIAKSFEQIRTKHTISLFKSYRPEFADGEQRRDFIYVKDAVELVYRCIQNPSTRGIYNIGSGHARSWNELARAIFAALGIEPRIEYIEMPEVLRQKYQYFTQADLSKLRQAGIDHVFFSLEDAVKDYVGYLKDNLYL